MKSLEGKELVQYVTRQLNSFFPDRRIGQKILVEPVNRALKRIEVCFSRINVKYYFDGKYTLFNHLNSDQYACFLYYLSNTVWKNDKNDELAAKIYYLNKALHGLDIYYEVEMPNVFLLVHPVGAVLGRGKYSDFFVAYQRVTVGGNSNLEYPVIGEGVVMYGGSALIGKCNLGDNCFISIGTIIMEMEIPSNVVVFGRPADVQYRKTNNDVITRYFNDNRE